MKKLYILLSYCLYMCAGYPNPSPDLHDTPMSGCEVLNGTTYCFHLEKKTAADARDFCNSKGSKLFEPKNHPISDFVVDEAKKKGMSQYWIGIHDRNFEDVFRYDSNDQEISWTNWDSGENGNGGSQPNNYFGGEDCVSVGVTAYSRSDGTGEKHIENSQVGNWWDTKCNFTKTFVCESYPQSLISTPMSSPPISGCEVWNGTTYCFQHEKKTAGNARAFCSSIGSKLFEPKNFPSSAFVVHEAKAKGMSQFWIGIHDLQREGLFRFDSNDEVVKWKNWNSDQPNNNIGGEDCVAIGLTKMSNSNGKGEANVSNSDAGHWWDQKCHFHKAFVCESIGDDIVSNQNILVVTGLGDSSFLNVTQTIEHSTTQNSWNNMKEYPHSLGFATGGLINGSPLICGGESWSDTHQSYTSAWSTHSECYKYDKCKNKWERLTSMNSQRYRASSSTVERSLFVTGGYDEDDNKLSTTEYIRYDGTVKAGPNLPSARYGHCMVTLDSWTRGKVMIIGGSPSENYKSVITFNTQTNTYNETIPSMNYDRRSAACALIKRSPMHENRPIVLVVGGLGQTTAEVYDYTQPNATWQEIASLPTMYDSSFYGATAVSSVSGQGAIVQMLENFYELSYQGNIFSWNILSQKLNKAVSFPVMMTPSEEYKCRR